jgi:hypothetical protein
MSKEYRSIAEAVRAKEQRIRMISNSRSKHKTYKFTGQTVEESRLHGNLKDFTAWKRNKNNKE